MRTAIRFCASMRQSRRNPSDGFTAGSGFIPASFLPQELRVPGGRATPLVDRLEVSMVLLLPEYRESCILGAGLSRGASFLVVSCRLNSLQGNRFPGVKVCPPP